MDNCIEFKKKYVLMFLNGRIEILNELLQEDNKHNFNDAIHKRNIIRLETIESIKSYIETQFQD